LKLQWVAGINAPCLHLWHFLCSAQGNPSQELSSTEAPAHAISLGKKMSPHSDSSGTACRLEGKYANYFAVGYNEHEFVIDFGQSYADNDLPEICSRIVTGPAYAKALLKTLRDSIEAFETAYGSIPDEGLKELDY
jgi:hypothetical protein